MNLNLNDETLRTVVAGAVVQHLTEDKRVELIQQAVQHLLTPVKDAGYGSYGKEPKSPLTDAFNNSVYQFAQAAVRDKLANDETFKKQVSDVIDAALQKALVEKREELVTKLASAISNFISLEK